MRTGNGAAQRWTTGAQYGDEQPADEELEKRAPEPIDGSHVTVATGQRGDEQPVDAEPHGDEQPADGEHDRRVLEPIRGRQANPRL